MRPDFLGLASRPIDRDQSYQNEDVRSDNDGEHERRVECGRCRHGRLTAVLAGLIELPGAPERLTSVVLLT